MSDCGSIYSDYFNKQLKKTLKKHKCIDRDFCALEKTIKTEKEKTKDTDRIPLGKVTHKVHKTRLFVLELRKASARVIWHLDEVRNNLLFIDIYLKSMQENHDPSIILQALDWYYGSYIGTAVAD